MTRHPFADAFDHHVWSTLKLLDICAGLSDEQLATNVPGLYGTMLSTVRHLVGADRWYLFVMTDGKVDQIEEDSMSVPELRTAMEPAGLAWNQLLATEPDPEAILIYHRDDGTTSHATWGVRLAQVVHHGSDHRSQICTALTTIGIEPPDIDVWAWAIESGRHWDS